MSPGPSSQLSSSYGRVSKACENCRQRRRKCDGRQPCSTCVKHGMSDHCYLRSKARPNRATVTEQDQSGSSVSPNYHMEKALERWATGRGYTLDLQLPDETLLTRLLRLPESVLPGNHHSWVNVFATFMARCKHHTSLLLPGQAEELIERFTRCPEKLQPDEMALVLAMLALGRQAETYLQSAEGEELFDEVTFYRLALGALDRCEQASPTALRALHILHLFALSLGGPIEIKHILSLMGAQCRQLGAHRQSSARLYRQEEELGRLFYLAVYKDTWFSSLHSTRQPLEFSQGEYDQTWTNHPAPHSTSRARYEESSLLVQLTLLENDVVARAASLHRLANDSLISLEERMHHWMKELREYEKQDGGMSGFANIRFHWMRLTIYIPLLDPPNRCLAPMAVVVASATAMLRTYSRLSATRYFYPKWVETRRILTAAYALLYGFIQGEVHLLDFLPTSDIATDLLERSRKNQPAVDRLIGTWKQLLEIAVGGQSHKDREFTGENTRVVNEASLFDYTLPTEDGARPDSPPGYDYSTP